jgi:hypothetical protein
VLPFGTRIPAKPGGFSCERKHYQQLLAIATFFSESA